MIAFALLALLGLALAMSSGLEPDVSNVVQDEPESPDEPTGDQNPPDDLLNEDEPDAESPPLPVEQPPFGDTGANETFNGTEQADTLNGGAGDDTLLGLGGDDSLFGDEAPRIGTGSPWNGNDLLDGGAGNDVLAGNGGNDTMLGGAGNDLIWDADLAWYDGENISVVDGGDGDDSIHVDGGSTVTGGAGNDSISVYVWDARDEASELTDFDPGDDSLSVFLSVPDNAPVDFSLREGTGGVGHELLNGDDVLVRFPGLASVTLDNIDIVVQADEDAGDATVTGDDSGLTILGNTSDNTLIGGDGDDRIIAGIGEYGAVILPTGASYQVGSNLAEGGGGNDTLIGEGTSVSFYYPNDDSSELIRLESVHRDTLNGGEGDDLLFSVHGNDLIGGDGADTFALVHVLSDIDPTQILDFNAAEDRIQVQVGWNLDGPVPRDIEIQVWDDGLGSDLYMDDLLIARITGGQTLTADDIERVDRIIV